MEHLEVLQLIMKEVFGISIVTKTMSTLILISYMHTKDYRSDYITPTHTNVHRIFDYQGEK